MRPVLREGPTGAASTTERVELGGGEPPAETSGARMSRKDRRGVAAVAACILMATTNAMTMTDDREHQYENEDWVASGQGLDRVPDRVQQQSGNDQRQPRADPARFGGSADQVVQPGAGHGAVKMLPVDSIHARTVPQSPFERGDTRSGITGGRGGASGSA